MEQGVSQSFLYGVPLGIEGGGEGYFDHILFTIDCTADEANQSTHRGHRAFSHTWSAAMQVYWNKRNLTRTGLVWDINISAVSLSSWDINLSAATSCENTL